MIRRSLKDRALPLAELESKHSSPKTRHFNDSSYFLGRGSDGSHMVVRLAFRNRKDPEYWLSIHLAGTGTFELQNMEANEGEEFQLGPLGFECIEPGKKWSIRYAGELLKDGTAHQVDLDLTFEGTKPLVNFKNISHPPDIAAVIAREKWNRAFFGQLREIKKVHLEQGGRITGKMVIDGEHHTVEWRSVRDHSWGTRSWATWKRHVWMGGVLDNGEAFNLSMITYDFLGQLSAGYMTRGMEIDYFSQLPDMDSFAAEPLVPGSTSIGFRTRDGISHKLEMTMPYFFDFTMDGIYRIREGMGDFILDGVSGMGVAEFGLNSKYYDTASL